jgi:alkanesulfonate monooxygenase SsuD/methylene tetrahydromethanopterin reductase-like flavin-dependent oxidoreductase (luciferase family)
VRLAVGIGRDLGLSEEQRSALASEARKLGYASAWTNTVGTDGMERCERWFQACGIATGTAAIPTPGLDLQRLAASARALHQRSGGGLVLGVGCGHPKDLPPEERGAGAVRLMEQHIAVLRRDFPGPIYLAAVGPQMLRLAGRAADGAIPNYMDASQIAWARARLDEGAQMVGRDPSTVKIAQFVRVSVHADAAVAREAIAKAAFAYALSTPGEPRVGTFRSMVRMGIGPDLERLEALRDQGVRGRALAEACPDAVLDRLGAWGTPVSVLPRLRALCAGLDVAIVRPVTTVPDFDAALGAIRACAPANWS